MIVLFGIVYNLAIVEDDLGGTLILFSLIAVFTLYLPKTENPPELIAGG